jgi:hypothetical protein
MPHYKSDPRQITARFQSTCPETGKTIKKGDDCIYYPRHRKAYHVDSKQAQSFREWQFDNSVLNSQY